ncbi:hypothetical protein MFU01_74810 [Myxococcus fulvus]|uniref:Peptidase C58 YopT-type domain-containing protein n=1 Tax=Myxococcus fulvus TaxID=33 RepID=A0A511TE45_MYXFU|nr:hypothetical protein MFU01_74810 [Myxococcus fulvus]
MTEFSQKRVARSKGLADQGYCLALSARWVRHIIDSEKDGWDVPKQSVHKRLQLLKDETVSLYALHQSYLSRQGKVLDMIDAQSALLTVAKSGLMEDQAIVIASELIRKGSTYVISNRHGSTAEEHAMALYRTGGVFSTCFYFFDPNVGEVFASSEDEAAFVINELMGPKCDSRTTEWNLLRCN